MRTAAQLLSATRRRRLLAECIRLAPQAAARLDVEGPVRAARARVREEQDDVRKCLVETTKLGLMLTVVARFARLEAAYGDGIAEQLTVVSDDFARASANISGSLVHRRWMPSNEARLAWCERVSKMKIDMLCPQHGKVYSGANVGRFIDWFSNEKVGILKTPASAAA